MFKRISELFKPKKQEDQTSGMTVDDLPAWLDKEEKTCISRRSEHISRSRDAIDKARDDIRNLLHDFGAEESEEPLHPKVEQVNRHNLPQFRRKIEAALDQEFSDDDEIYYRQVAEMVDGCFKAYQGPGRYLHHLYADEVKLFRQSMDHIGKELNQLTEIIRISRMRLGRIEMIRKALERYNHVEDERSSVLHQRNSLDQKRGELVSKQNHLVEERDQISEGAEIKEYLNRLRLHDEDRQRIGNLFEALDSLIRTALPVWKKTLRIVQDERDREKEKILDNLIQMAVLQKFDDPAFLSLVKSTSAWLFVYIREETVPLKNSFEKTLFCDDENYVNQISGVVTEWMEADRNWKEDQILIASHPAAVRLSAFESGIQELIRDIRHVDEEIGKSEGKTHHLDREKSDAVKTIREEIRELTEGAVTVSGLGIDLQEKT